MKDLAKDIVAKIKEGHILPESKWRTHWKSYVFWLLLGCMIIIGALFVSLVIFNVSDIDPRFFQSVGLRRLVMILFITAPYLWIVLSLLALVFGVMAFRKTTRGYRQSTIFITSLVVLVVSILGVTSHMLRIDHQMGGFISRNTPPHLRDFANPREGRWQRPGDGLIGGEVVSLGVQEFTLKTFDGSEWHVVYDRKSDRDDVDAILVGEKVGVIGEKIGDFSMHAFSIKKFPDDWSGEPPRGPMPLPSQDGQFPSGGFMPLPPPDIRMPN